MKLGIFDSYDITLPRDRRGYFGSVDDDSCDSYDERPSYTKYGGYNGYDDDTIDSAFEGMPEATWNVD